jgi:HD superfamily phosphohydrolase
MTAHELRRELHMAAPVLSRAVEMLAADWAAPVLATLDRLRGKAVAFPKTFTDPSVGPIELFEWEIILVDSPLLQRLRGIRHLGMAHTVYPGATHDRLSHSLGVVEVTERMICALRKNAEYHRKFGSDADPNVSLPTEEDRFALRLAALLHDIGHGPFSHATEPLMEAAAETDFDATRATLRTAFPGAAHIKPSEALAVLIVLSNALQSVFEHPRFSLPYQCKDEIASIVSARILGSRKDVGADYIAGVICGAIDADKLDYMARDSYFTGLPIGLDVSRLVNKLEVVTITPERAFDPELRKRAELAPNQRLYELGISVSGVTAYEQMIIGRVLLYDRVYYHQKVRCAEAMVRLLLEAVASERGRAFSIAELFTNVSDDGLLFLLSGGSELGASQQRTETKPQNVATRLRNRQFYHRAFAFAERYIAGLDQLDEQDQRDTKSGLWQTVLEDFTTAERTAALKIEIFTLAEKLRLLIPALTGSSSPEFGREDIIVDLPEDRVTVPSAGPFLRTESGGLTTANLFFNPDKWSEAYKNQKKVGYVFAPREHTVVVAIAAEIIWFEKYGLIMRSEARQLCKTDNLLAAEGWSDWKDKALAGNLCSPECHAALTHTTPRLLRFHANDFRLPDGWNIMEPNVAARLAKESFIAFAGGVVSSVHRSITDAIEHLCAVIDSLEKNAQFIADKRPDEKGDLQSELMKLLNARGCAAREAPELAGGESDIVLPGDLILENKVAGTTSDVTRLKPDAAWQARRYSISLNRRISFVAIAYRPADESVFLPLPARITIRRLENSPEECAYVRLLIPWGYGTPSKAKAPLR